MTTKLSLLFVLLLLALPVASAEAKSPPKGKYACSYTTFSGTFSAGILYITSKSTYNVNRKGKGRYSTSGRRIRWRTGSYANSDPKTYGVWRREVGPSGTSYEIRLRRRSDDREVFVCETRPR